MNYSVLWRPIAEAAFLASMLRSVDKPSLWKVAHAINNALATDPNSIGESREGGWRLYFERPYTVLFFVDEPNRTVYVEQIKCVGQ